MSTELQIIPMAELRVISKDAAKSKMFSAKSEEQILMITLLAQAEGTHPIKALMSYEIIQGQPALKASEALARYMDAGGTIKWIKSDRDSAKAIFSHPSSGEFEYEYDTQDATEAGLINKDNWKKNKKAMLRARCTSAGIRMSYPRCLNNLYTSEEVTDFDPPKEEIEDVQIEEVVDNKNNHKVNMQLLATKLKKEHNFNDAMLKEFGAEYDLANNSEKVEELLSDNADLLDLVDDFNKQ